jgi:D-alanyl-D-alanine carboxypeptidase (penicillin-binding protein 5/6)
MFDFLALLFGVAEPVGLPSPDLIGFDTIPVLTGESPAPIVNAKSALVYDLGSGKVLFEKSAHTRRPVASLTKLATALTVREHFDLTEIVTVSENAAAQPPAKVWLRPGEKISVEALLNALLIESGNDAAIALSEHFPGGQTEFVKAMNIKIESLNLKNTHFANPVGYDDEAGQNYSSAYDLAIIGNAVLSDPVLQAIVGTHRRIVTDEIQSVAHPLVSTNILFNSYLNIQGLKTGSTDAAGECVAAIARLESSHEVLAIVLDSPNRFQEAKNLLEWANRNFRW